MRHFRIIQTDYGKALGYRDTKLCAGLVNPESDLVVTGASGVCELFFLMLL